MSADVRALRPGRLLSVRLRPNLDTVTAIEALAEAEDIDHATIVAAIGSLVDAELAHEGRAETQKLQGPGIEFLSLAGEIRRDRGVHRADLTATISTPDASVHGGRLVKGGNPICITLELVLQEWLEG